MLSDSCSWSPTPETRVFPSNYDVIIGNSHLGCFPAGYYDVIHGNSLWCDAKSSHFIVSQLKKCPSNWSTDINEGPIPIRI